MQIVDDVNLMDRFIAWLKETRIKSSVSAGFFSTGPTKMVYAEWVRIAEQYGAELFSTTTSSQHTRNGTLHEFRFGAASIKENAQ